MSTTTPEQIQESCVPTWNGLSLERATVLNTAHIATLNAALTGIHAVVDVLHDREAQRCAGEATHCPSKNMGLLAAVHSLATLVRMHTSEHEEDLPDFIRDAQGVKEVRSASYNHLMRRTVQEGKTAEWAQEQQAQHHQKQQPKQAENHAHQAQAAIKDEAQKPARRTVNTSAQPIQ